MVPLVAPMMALVSRRVLGWTGLVVLLVIGITIVGGLVEHGDKEAPLERVFRDLPVLLVMLSPLVVGLGAGLARSRMMSAGDDLALALCGIGLPHTVPVVVVIGLFVGGASWGIQEGVVATMPPQVSASWVWVDGAAVRVADGVRVMSDKGTLHMQEGPPLEQTQITTALQRVHPETAPIASLNDDGSPAVQVESHRRWARVLGCVFLALIGWWPVTSRPTAQLGWVVSVVIVTQVTDLILLATAGAGHMEPWIGAWAGWAIPVLFLGMTGLRKRYFVT